VKYILSAPTLPPCGSEEGSLRHKLYRFTNDCVLIEVLKRDFNVFAVIALMLSVQALYCFLSSDIHSLK